MVLAEKDLRDLYQRAAASRFVVVGTIENSKGIGRRSSEGDSQKTGSASADGNVVTDLPTLGGSLYSVRIEEVLCHGEDFSSKPSSVGTIQPAKTLYIFIPRDEPMFANGQMQEIFLPGQRYLLFLAAPAPQVLEKWLAQFQLDPTRDYYRGEELSRGIVPLFRQSGEKFIPKQPPVVEKVRRLCRAVQPPTLEGKLALLRKLQDSDDPVLKDEAQKAVSALQAQGSQSN
jgi:hypothetical protein